MKKLIILALTQFCIFAGPVAIGNIPVSQSTGFSANPVTIDNTPGGPHDYLSKATDLTGIADGTTFIISAWFKRTVTATEEHIVSLGSAGDGFHLYINSSDEIVVDGYDSAAVLKLRVKSNVTVTDTSWHHIMVSLNLADTGQRHLYLDGTDRFSSVTYDTAATLEFTQGTAAICSRGDSFGTFTGCVAEIFFHTSYLDLSTAPNRAKFYNSGQPVNLGSDGSTPLSTQPLLYLKNAFGTFANNAGSGGNFTVNGTLTACGTLP